MLKIITFLDRFAKTAKTDIPCYKVLQRRDNNSIVYSPYQNHPFILNQKETAIIKRSFFSGTVDHGFHAFVNLSDAINLSEKLKVEQRQIITFNKICPNQEFSTESWNWLVEHHKQKTTEVWRSVPIPKYDTFHCIIPKESKYYSGVWYSKYPTKLIPNIAADNIIVLRGINDVEETATSFEKIQNQSIKSLTDVEKETQQQILLK